MTENTEILAKIQKLLNLASSPNEAESMAASEKAHELLKKYNLSLSDLPGEKTSGIEEVTIDTRTNVSKWQTLLINAIAKYNYCQLILVKSTGENKLNLLGKEYNIAACKAMIDYLVSTVEKMSKSIPQSNKGQYKLGMSACFIERLMTLQEKEKNDPDSRALVVQSDAEIQQKLKERGTVTRNMNTTRGAGFSEGYMDGKGVSLSAQLS